MLSVLASMLLTGCGNGYIDCGEGLPFEPVAQSDLLPVRIGTAVPTTWKSATLDHLSYETPAPPLPPIYEDRQNPAHRRCISWNGELFADNADATLLVAITPNWQLEKAVGAAAGQFVPVTVPGADSAVARLSRQQYFDGGGEKIEGQRTTVLQIVVQSGPSTYTIDGSFAPGSAGEAVAAALLGSVVVH